MTAINSWAERGRDRKARHIVAALDLAMRGLGIDPESAYAVDMVAKLDEAVWTKAIAQAAADTGIAYDHASEETRTLVREMFRTRAGLAALDREAARDVERAGKSIDIATAFRRSTGREEPPPHGPACSCHSCYEGVRQ